MEPAGVRKSGEVKKAALCDLRLKFISQKRALSWLEITENGTKGVGNHILMAGGKVYISKYLFQS